MTKTQFIRQYASEKLFTAATNRYINANYPKLRHFYFHIPNESVSSDLMRMQLTAQGVLAGVPDFCFLLPKLWFLELKQPNGRLSDRQALLHELWINAGIRVYVAYSAEEVVEILEKVVILS